MIFTLLMTKRDEADDTGTYADGAFDLPAIDLKASPRRIRGHAAHQRDYGRNRTIEPIPAGFA
ncbi:hypothetical protein [Pararhizobium sp.]|jgi:hypothetical protein|uniref:hypothetical protein n=1 Tax=Pararhizobium sp. TaxID=1977563 RepID=UPI003BA900F8